MTIDNSYSLGVVLKGIAEVGRRAIRMDSRADFLMSVPLQAYSVVQTQVYYAEEEFYTELGARDYVHRNCAWERKRS